MSNSLGSLIVLGVGVGCAYAGSQGKLPSQLQKYWDQYIGNIGATPGTPPVTSAPSAAAIAAFSAGLSQPNWIATLYVADKGALPPSIPALQAWGQAKGYYDPSNLHWNPPAGVS